LEFDIEINVSKDGKFYFSLGSDQQKILLDYGVDLSRNINRHTHKIGTFYADTLEKLEKDFRCLLEEAISGEVIEDKFVILYRIRTACNYCMGGGVPVPNGYYVPQEERLEGNFVNWIEGTDKGEGSFGFNVYAQVYHKQIIRFKSGGRTTVRDYNGDDEVSNNHIIIEPDSELRKKVMKVKNRDYIEIKGYLVEGSFIEDKGYVSSFRSSLVRNDDGGFGFNRKTSCEIIYITDLEWLD
jgi:hypothetical protein